MKLTYQQILNSTEALKILANEKMPYRNALKISKNISELEKQITDYKIEYTKLAEKYFEKDNNDNFKTMEGNDQAFIIKEGKRNECTNDINELNNFQVEVQIYKIPIEDLDGIMLTPSIAGTIEYMIEE